jgi:hypothetical protein
LKWSVEKKIEISIRVQDAGRFKTGFSSGFMGKKHAVFESLDDGRHEHLRVEPSLRSIEIS